jgi:hypothetical protein
MGAHRRWEKFTNDTLPGEYAAPDIAIQNSPGSPAAKRGLVETRVESRQPEKRWSTLALVSQDEKPMDPSPASQATMIIPFWSMAIAGQSSSVLYVGVPHVAFMGDSLTGAPQDWFSHWLYQIKPSSDQTT